MEAQSVRLSLGRVMSHTQFRRELWCMAVLALLALTGAARSEELPISVLTDIPLTASIANWGKLYSWVDGSPQSVKLALSNPGLSASPQVMAPTWAPLRMSDPIATGYGARAGIGFIAPKGFFPAPASDVRVQLVTSYVDAGVAQQLLLSQGSTDFGPFGPISAGCGTGIICLGSLASATNYQNWQTELKGMADFSFGRLIVSPSLSVFAKDAQSRQSILQGMAYSNWAEYGGRVEIDSTVDITKNALFGLRGSVGTAYRATSFTGSSVFDDPSVGQISALGTGSPVFASAEGSFLWKPVPWQTIKLYAGVQFDNRVPVAPDLVGIDLGLGGPSTITYETVRNFYLGSNFKVRLD
jgi:hypothetical protein